MKITTKPEKWFIEITDENRPHLKKYWETLPDRSREYKFQYAFLLSEPWDGSYQYSADREDLLRFSKSTTMEGAVELTFKEFQELIWKPYKGRKVTVNMIKSHPYFRSLTVDELRDVIGNDMDHSEYLKLPGRLAYDKAQTMAATFAKQEVGKVEKADGKKEVRKFNPEKWNILCHNFEQAYLVFKYIKPRCGQDFEAQIKHIRERTDVTYPLFIECDLEQGQCDWEFSKRYLSNLTPTALSRQITFEVFSSLTGNEPFDPENWNIVVSTREQVKAVTSYLADKLQDESIRGCLENVKLPHKVRFNGGNDWWGHASIESLSEDLVPKSLYPIERQITFHQFLTLTNKPIEPMEFILPDKWCILRTPETAVVINKYFNGKGEGFYNSKQDWLYSEKVDSESPAPYVAVSYDRDPANPKHKGFTPITFEQFKKHVLNQQTMTENPISFDPLNWNIIVNNPNQAREVLQYLAVELGKGEVHNINFLDDCNFPHRIRRTAKEFYHNSLNFHDKEIEAHYDPKNLITFNQFLKLTGKEIEGYICPMDMFGGRVKVGDLYVPHPTDETIYRLKSIASDYKNATALDMPKEIVETWEPKFKEDKYKVGTYVKVITGGSGAFFADGRVGVVTTREEALKEGNDYHGENNENIAELYVKFSNKFYGGLCPGFKVEIITEAEYKKAHIQLPEINGYEGKIEGNSVTYGCRVFAISDVVDLKRIMDQNEINWFKIADNWKITIREIKAIVKYLEEYKLI